MAEKILNQTQICISILTVIKFRKNSKPFLQFLDQKTVFQLYIEIQFYYNVLDHEMLKNTQCYGERYLS